MRFLFLLLSFLIFTTAKGQVPTTNIYLFNLQKKNEDYQLSNAKLLSNFNPDGYNNQASFFSFNDIYISTQSPDKSQTDIYQLDLANNNIVPFTDTKEAEYSPTLMPDGKSLSCIKVLNDENSSQMLWEYPLDKSHSGKAIFTKLANVGYHCWLSENLVALFLLEETNNLAIANKETGLHRIILENIGRTLIKDNSDQLLFVHKINDDIWYIKSYDHKENRAKIITKTLAGKEDFELLDDGTIIMGQGSKLFAYKSDSVTRWKEIADLKDYGINDITRLEYYRNRLIVTTK